MKTVTEFPGIVLREAAGIRRLHRPAPVAPPAAPAPAESEAASPLADEPTPDAPSSELADAPSAELADAPSAELVDAPAVEAAAGDEAAGTDVPAPEGPPPEGPTPDGPAPEEPAPEAPQPEVAEAAAPVVDEGAIAAAAELEEKLDIKGDRLARLMEALDVIRDRADNVRLVRVMSGEDPPPGAKKQGDFYYLVDLMPRAEPRRNDRGRGGPGRH